MLINKINVLDHGYVGLLSVNLSQKNFKSVSDNYFKARINRELFKVANATFILKVPLFVQVFLSQYDLKIINLPPKNDNEIYIPDVSEINTGNANDDKNISEHIKQTLDALNVNAKGFQMEGCDRFTSQVTTPISKYNEILIHGNLQAWLEIIKRKNLPRQIKVYKDAIEELLKTEWLDLNTYKEAR